jgi:hypothetical protein
MKRARPIDSSLVLVNTKAARTEHRKFPDPHTLCGLLPEARAMLWTLLSLMDCASVARTCRRFHRELLAARLYIPPAWIREYEHTHALFADQRGFRTVVARIKALGMDRWKGLARLNTRFGLELYGKYYHMEFNLIEPMERGQFVRTTLLIFGDGDSAACLQRGIPGRRVWKTEALTEAEAVERLRVGLATRYAATKRRHSRAT